MIRIVVLLLTIFTIEAHQVSESFLKLTIEKEAILGRWDACLRDLEIACGLDVNKDDAITWAEVQEAKPRLELLLNQSIRFAGILSAGPLRLIDIQVEKRSPKTYLVLSWKANLPAPTAAMEYTFMFDNDQYHRTIVSIQQEDREYTTVLSADQRTLNLDQPTKGSFAAFVWQGVIHIWKGFDHLLFLCALLLPAVVAKGGSRLSFTDALWQIGKIVTAFTLAHSVTLSLAALDLVRLPTSVVEPLIAFSVVVAALNNLTRVWADRSWLLAFAFGLLHGFGFASVMAEIDLQPGSIIHGLLGFNLGVEAGQMAIVLLFVPIAFCLRESWVYRRVALVGGSCGIAIIASIWLIERTFSVAIFSMLPSILGR